MKRLDFGSYGSTEWQEFKRIHREMFWEEVHEAAFRQAKGMLHEQICKEFEEQVGAERYERTAGRRGERNGKRVRAYEIAQAFGQSRFSRSYLQRLVKGFEEQLHGYHRRSIQNWPYVFIDGMGVKVRDVYLKDKLVVFAMGMDDEHRWEVLDWVVADREDEGSARGLLGDLKRRALTDPKLFISDDAAAILSALRVEYPRAVWQSCAFHKISALQRHLKNIGHRKEILREAGDIYALSQTRTEAIERFKTFRTRWRQRESEAVRLFSRGFEDTLRHFDFPRLMWISLYTNNPMEQFIGKLRTWTGRYNYFQGHTNLELSVYTYVCHKNGELVSDSARSSSTMPIDRISQNPTLLVA